MPSDSPAKRVRLTPPAESQPQLDNNADFVAFDLGEDDHRFQPPTNVPTGPRDRPRSFPRREDPRHRLDKPKSKHKLPGTEVWVLVRTKLDRRFVHNVETKESFWRIPRAVQAAVDVFDIEEEKSRNMQWSEEQLKSMRQQQKSAVDDHTRRRRSESLQREDEEAMMAELAAQAEHAEEQDVKMGALSVAEGGPKGYVGDASDSEYEYVEVTDTEGEGGGDDEDEADATAPDQPVDATEPPEPGPVDFGEDDIAYQLAMMGESYGLDPEEYEADNGDQDDYDEEADGLPLSDQEATALFHQMLDDHEISPFTPWDKLIADASAQSIVFDQRYTILRSSRARKEAWDQWSRARAAEIKLQRATEERNDPRIAYLRFLADNATTKLYWPEFRRKFKREPEMNDRLLHDKDREKFYRELIAKLKLPESKRQEELRTLLKDLSKDTASMVRNLPNKVLLNVVLYALPRDTRDKTLRSLGFDIPAV